MGRKREVLFLKELSKIRDYMTDKTFLPGRQRLFDIFMREHTKVETGGRRYNHKNAWELLGTYDESETDPRLIRVAEPSASAPLMILRRRLKQMGIKDTPMTRLLLEIWNLQ